MEYWNVGMMISKRRILIYSVPCQYGFASKSESPFLRRQYSIVPAFQLCLPAIALAQARRAGAKRTKFMTVKGGAS